MATGLVDRLDDLIAGDFSDIDTIEGDGSGVLSLRSGSSAALAFSSPAGEVGVCGLLMMPRYQNIKLEMRTCSYSGLRGLANLI